MHLNISGYNADIIYKKVAEVFLYLDASKVITSTSNVMANVVKSFYNNKPIYVTPFGINIDIFLMK